MKFAPMLNMEKDYWYEITLNEETMLGFDDTGAKILTIYPEGKAPENEKKNNKYCTTTTKTNWSNR